MRFPSCCTQHIQPNRCTACDAVKNRNTQCMNAKNNACNQFYSLRLLRFSCACIAYVAVFLICRPAYVTSNALRTASCKPILKSVFTGIHAVSKLSYATHATQPTHGLQRNQNTEIHNACTRKTMHAIDSILCVRCIFRVHALRALHCVRQLGNKPFSPFSAC